MKYFQSFPQIASIDYVGNNVVLTNIMVRSEILPNLLNNPLLFYSYDIQNGDTPEIIAEKYYSDSYRYWIVLFANQIIDPQWNWPMTTSVFQDYIVDKYTSATANALHISANTVTTSQVIAYTQGTIKNYIKSVTVSDNLSQTPNTTIYMIDSTAYANVPVNKTQASFPGGAIVSQITNKYTQSIYDYELQQNETRRNINLVNVQYISQFEKQFKYLMSQ
jgi:hypothetical protein